MIEILKALDAPNGTSGGEQAVADVVKCLFAPWCDRVYTDRLGSVIGEKKSKMPHAPKLLLDAHMDEVGLIVTKIEKNGFLLFAPIGGIDPKILPACDVLVHGRQPVPGVIGALPPHLKEESSNLSFADMAIDTGLDNAEDLVRVGDIVTFCTGVLPLGGTIVAGRTFDDRAGIAIVAKVLEQVQNTKFHLYATASVQEEVGGFGAATAAYALMPDYAIVIDVTHGDTPDAPKDRTFPLGGGIVLTVGPNVHPAFADEMRRIAAEKGYPIQIDVDTGDTGTNGWPVQVAGNGVKTLVFSVPLRYMHTTYEVLDIRDLEASVKLICAFLEEGMAV